MKKKFIPSKSTKSVPKQNIRYKIKDKSKLFEISTCKRGWQPVELLRYTKSGKLVLRLLFSNQIIVRKFGKRIRPYQKR